MNTKQPDFKPVYILGAGASCMIGGPLLKDFMAKARELRYASFFREEELIKMFDKVFDYQGELSKTKAFIGSDLDNLENLFSMLDMDREIESVNSKTGGYNSKTDLRECLITLIIKTLESSITVGHPNWINYERIINNLAKPQNATFITFNYDLSIEQALESRTGEHGQKLYRVDYGTTFDRLNRDSNERLVLKLHGSANWVHCLNCNKFTSHLMEYLMPPPLASETHRFHAKNCTSIDKFINIIIPPTWNKLNYINEITKVWFRSIQEISQATHLFIIGYSFPRTDIFFDQLLGLALRNIKNLQKVIIINPGLEVNEILKEFFEHHFLVNRVLFLPMKFQDVLNSLIKEIPSKQMMDGFIEKLYQNNR